VSLQCGAEALPAVVKNTFLQFHIPPEDDEVVLPLRRWHTAPDAGTQGAEAESCSSKSSPEWSGREAATLASPEWVRGSPGSPHPGGEEDAGSELARCRTQSSSVWSGQPADDAERSELLSKLCGWDQARTSSTTSGTT